MADNFPKDRFDQVPDDLQRVGSHRAPARKGRGWIGFGWAALATVLLVGLGVVGLFMINGNIAFKSSPPTGVTSSPTASSASHTPTPTPTATITPKVDPSLRVSVLNGTSTSGLASTVATKLTTAGWKVVTRGNATTTTVASTVVYYSDAANQAAALGVTKSIPGASVQLSQLYAGKGADLTVVVGSDYQHSAG